MTLKEYRKTISNMIYSIYDIFDKTGYNTDLKRAELDSLSDEEFFKYMDTFLNDENINFQIEIEPFNKKSMVKFKDLYIAANKLGIALEEYVELPYMSQNTKTDNIPCTNTPVPVGYLHIKTLQQKRSKKNKLATTAESRNILKGQVTGEDKGGFITDVDIYLLTALNAQKTLKELCGPRSDDFSAKEEQIEQIKRYGTSTQENRVNNVENKQSLNTLNVYLMGAGLYTDLITDDYILPYRRRELKREILSGK